MKFFLSSEGISAHSARLTNLWTEGSQRIGIIANAVDYESRDERDAHLARQVEALTTLGFESEDLDLRRYFGRPNYKLTRRITQNYGGLWVTGGNTFNLARAMAQSDIGHKEMIDLFEGTGRVYAAYSAGACVLAHSLKGIELVDDPLEIPPGYQAETPFEGLGMMSKLVVPHYRSPNNPISPNQEKLVTYLDAHSTPYVTLHDGDALIIDNDSETLLR